MPRSLLPPRGVEMPTSLLYDRNISPAVRDTWLQIRGLAWGAKQTPEVTMETLVRLTGKSQSTIYEHMRLLGKWKVIRWLTPRKATFVFEFDDNEQLNTGYSEKLESNSNAQPDSEFLEKTPLDPSAMNIDSAKGVIKESPNFRKVGMENRRKPDTVSVEILHPIIDALAVVTHTDKKLNYSRLAKESKALHLAGYTAAQVISVYGAGGKWYAVDWRGQKGEIPNLGVIRPTIKALLETKNGVVKTPPPEDRTAAAIRRRLERLENKPDGK